jgi:hydroxymethylglutaryl-CoA lyase
MDEVKIIECPRDAWQGLAKTIPTETKAAYLGKLIEFGFRHLDVVSFVAPQYVPQMADSELVMKSLTLVGAGLRVAETGESTVETRPAAPNSELRVSSFDLEMIGIVVNDQGLRRALATPGVTTIGYPYSVSANFRRTNANMSLSESRALAVKLKEATEAADRNLVVYISMAFGNPYGEPWSPEMVEETLEWLNGVGVKSVSLADTAGVATARDVGELFRAVRNAAGDIELGVHLHSRPEGVGEKVLAAYEAGCRRFDSALTGLGGCPFAGDELVGNIPTEIVVSTLAARQVATGIEPWAMLSAVEATQEIRRHYAP